MSYNRVPIDQASSINTNEDDDKEEQEEEETFSPLIGKKMARSTSTDEETNCPSPITRSRTINELLRRSKRLKKANISSGNGSSRQGTYYGLKRSVGVKITTPMEAPQPASSEEDSFIPSPIVRKQTMTPTSKVIVENVSQDFSIVDPFHTMSSYLKGHLEKVKKALIGEIPTETIQVANLKSSMFKLANSVELPQLARTSFQKIALQLNDVSFFYTKAKNRFDSAHNSLKRLRDVQNQKTNYTDAFMALEPKRKETLARQEEVNIQIERNNIEISRLQKEMEGLRSESIELSKKLNTYSSKTIQLYTQSSSLDNELVTLLSQKSVIERDMIKGKDEIAEANQSWDRLHYLFVNASKPIVVETEEASYETPVA